MAKAWNTDIEIKGHVFYHWPEGWCEKELRLCENSEVDKEIYDVAILGAGVVGCALAFRLSQYNLRLLIIDRNHDVGEGTSKANSAIIHTGFDAEPGSLESQLVVRASSQWPEISRKLKIPFKKPSALVLALNKEEKDLLPKLLDKSLQNGIQEVELVTGDEARELERNISPSVLGALHVKREGIVDPFAATIAFAEIAVVNGATLLMGLEAQSIEDAEDGIKNICCNNGSQFKARYIINAAGLGSRDLGKTYQAKSFDINPRRGQFIIYDKLAHEKISRILLPVPNPVTKGILVAPTIFGNIIAGPTAEDLPEGAINETGTTAEGMAAIKKGALKLFPRLAEEPVIGSYAGLRCNCSQGQYKIIFNDGKEGIVTLTGIRSTGLSSSFALAEHVVKGLENGCGLKTVPNNTAIDHRPVEARPGWTTPRPYESEEKLELYPDYARMVCFCEQISQREIINAMESPLRPRTIDSIRRRTRAATGPCQSFYCAASIGDILSEHTGIRLNRITKKGPGSEIIAGSN